MKYLKIFTDFISTLDELKDDEAGRLFRAMLKYAEDGTEPALSGNERYAWGFARLTINRTRIYSDTKAESGRISINSAMERLLFPTAMLWKSSPT